jgi:hypothetical protein
MAAITPLVAKNRNPEYKVSGFPIAGHSPSFRASRGYVGKAALLAGKAFSAKEATQLSVKPFSCGFDGFPTGRMLA